ncbi:hypothetical protein KIW84_076003 [Lathyrus oleraceus]|uniref:Uncharacterized protein n=1 Tax=Pisum sativum TaxID=3888 RepID=A0A9D4VY73_PEA|nr:hypothetical protein KIW84_076003 [Pisum sativum]
MKKSLTSQQNPVINQRKMATVVTNKTRITATQRTAGKESPVEPSLPSKNAVAVVYRSAKGCHVYTREYSESVMLAAGVAIGYGTLMTLTGTSNKIKKGFTNQSHK